MSCIYVSIVVTENSRTLENTILRSEIPLDRELAIRYRDDLDEWLELLPGVGQPKQELTPDKATLLALELPQILGERNPELFSPYYLDPEGDAALIERRPYDWTRLEEVA